QVPVPALSAYQESEGCFVQGRHGDLPLRQQGLFTAFSEHGSLLVVHRPSSIVHGGIMRHASTMTRRSNMDSISLLREQLRAAHEYLDGTMADVTPEQMHWIPPGKVTP